MTPRVTSTIRWLSGDDEEGLPPTLADLPPRPPPTLVDMMRGWMPREPVNLDVLGPEPPWTLPEGLGRNTSMWGALSAPVEQMTPEQQQTLRNTAVIAGVGGPVIGPVNAAIDAGLMALPQTWGDVGQLLQMGGTKAAAVIRRPTTGFISALRARVESRLPAKATAEQLQAIAREAPAEEVARANLPELGGGRLSKEDVLRHIEQRAVPLEETLRTEEDVKYGSYRTPGGEDYRELLLRMPTPEARKRIQDIEAEQNAIRMDPLYNNRPAMRDRFYALEIQKNALAEQIGREAQEYTSSHWPGEPNVLAHTRLNTFTDPQGKKVLLVDEIQSDWLQDLREFNAVPKAQQQAKTAHDAWNQKGQQPGPEQQAYEKALAKLNAARKEIRGRTRPPDAPFQTDWHELVFKRALREAAESGADKMAWTTGEQQAARYDLSKQVDSIHYSKEEGRLWADKNGGSVLDEHVPPEQLPQYIGKEAAQKLLQQPVDPDSYDRQSLRGEGLQVGGEGMKAFYDEMIPKFANRYLKSFGIKTSTTKLPTGEGAFLGWEVVNRATGEQIDLRSTQADAEWAARHWGERYGAEFVARPKDVETQTYHSIDITPDLRKLLLSGQPLFGSKK